MGYTGHSSKIRYDKKGKFIDPEDDLLGSIHTGMFGGNSDKPKRVHNGKWESHHYNGEVEEVGQYKDRKMEGLWKFFYDNGQLEVEGSYSNDKMEGEWIYYDEEGYLSERRYYLKGKRTGEWLQYCSNGDVFTRMNYKNNELNGENITYYDSGQIKSIWNYRDDEFDGECIHYNKICELRNGGLTYKQISNKLNELGHKPTRGKVGEFTPQKVWSNYTKIKKNQERKVEVLSLVIDNVNLIWKY
jgi:antitoxin component YwqK of YwqJK toxin-antitoxin module